MEHPLLDRLADISAPPMEFGLTYDYKTHLYEYTPVCRHPAWVVYSQMLQEQILELLAGSNVLRNTIAEQRVRLFCVITNPGRSDAQTILDSVEHALEQFPYTHQRRYEGKGGEFLMNAQMEIRVQSNF